MLNVWFGNEQQEWQLLYRASKDGFSAAAFHSKCDGHSPTFTVVLVSSKSGEKKIMGVANTPEWNIPK